MNRKNPIWLAIIISVSCLHAGGILAAELQYKPQHPLQISISPAQPGIDLNAIQAGDVVELAATAISSHDAGNMTVTVKLSGGVDLVSGDLSWSGPAVKMEPRSIRFSVRVPEQGIGRIMAQVSITNGKKDLTRKAQYLLMTGKERQEQQKMKASKPAKKDSKGRLIVEY